MPGLLVANGSTCGVVTGGAPLGCGAPGASLVAAGVGDNPVFVLEVAGTAAGAAAVVPA